jgi:arylsulfatase B
MTHRYSLATSAAVALLVLGLLPGPARAQHNRNILMIIADDVGVDMIGAYKAYEHDPYEPPVDSDDLPPTPNLDELASEGILFRNLWSNPVCAATRATIQTGRYGYRTGVRTNLETLSPETESSIAEILSRDPELGYTHAAFGKWGLGLSPESPVRTGYDLYQGNPAARIDDYFAWVKYTSEFDPASTDPACDLSDPAWRDNLACIAVSTDSISDYVTAENAIDTLDWISDLPPDQPWFAILSFNAPHLPYHAPPGFDQNLECGDLDRPICYRAMIEAMDREIGPLLDFLLPRGDTTIIFLADNGTPQEIGVGALAGTPGKGSVYERGINVPLIIAGAGVEGEGRVSEALVNTTDLFMTVLDLAGVDSSVLPPTPAEKDADMHDSFSLVPILSGNAEHIREYTYAERENKSPPESYKAIRNRDGYKLMVSSDRDGHNPTWEFYSLSDSDHPFEHTNLVDSAGNWAGPNLDPDAQAALADLKSKLGAPGLFEDPNLPAANLDPDADGVPDDGDDSGVPGDAPCAAGQTEDCDDNCSDRANPDQGDRDADGVGDGCDNCLERPNPKQYDSDLDGYGNLCDADFSQNGKVGFEDWVALRATFWKKSGEDGYDEQANHDCNGIVGMMDFFLFRSLFARNVGPSGQSCASADKGSCPENPTCPVSKR